MEFNIKRNTFLSGIQKTLGIVDRKTTMPILSNILIRTEENGRIKIVATDKELGLISRYDADIIQPGDITLSAKKLYEMIRELQGEDIHLKKSDNHQVTMTSQKVIYKINGLPADEFPNVLESDEIPFYKVQAQVLKDLIRKTSFAISTDEMRVNLNGVYFETEDSVNGPRLKMAATDGHRLAIAYSQPGEHGGLILAKGVIIPRKGLMEIRKLVEDEAGEIMIGIDHGMFFVKTLNTTLKISLIDGEYPDYRRVVPVDKGTLLRFNKDAVLHALKRMNVMSSERYNGVILTLMENRLILNSTNPDVGEANDEIEVSYEGDEVRVGYNVAYLIDAIDVVDDDDVLFEIRPGMKPGMVRMVGDDSYTCVVMPLKV
ncbi:MAG: DNA polymerase III subunit beta [Syntrophales bacterium]|nr:DNA polymerase III subunit beta [Syntrophales bacterium]